MQIVVERNMVPRPIQRPSDIERRPIDFGIESPPPAAAKAEATIVKPAISDDFETVVEQSHPEPKIGDTPPTSDLPIAEDDWGDGILEPEKS